MMVHVGHAAGAIVVGLALSSGMLPPAFGQTAPPEAADASPPLLANTGKKPGPAFFVDLTKGFDPDTQYLSDFKVDLPGLLMVFESENIRFDRNGMTLSVEKNGEGDMPYTTSEFQHRGFYGFGRYEVVMRATNAPGVVSSFFTHTDDYHGDPHAEIDFEFLGKAPRQVDLNHFHEGDNDPQDIDLWFDASQGEHLYAFEWLPHSITWFIDGVKVREVTAETSPVAIPTASSRVIVNTWVGNRNTLEWVGEAEIESAAAVYRCISHVPVGAAGKQCSNVFTPPPKP